MYIFLFLVSLLVQKPNYCSCVPLGSINDMQYNEYSLIAKGKVAKVIVQDFERTIYLAVDTYYKGVDYKAELKVTTPKQEGSCGIMPDVGETWLMFVYTNGTDYRTSLCTRTKNMNPKAWNYNKNEIAEDIKFLLSKQK